MIAGLVTVHGVGRVGLAKVMRNGTCYDVREDVTGGPLTGSNLCDRERTPRAGRDIWDLNNTRPRMNREE